MACFVTVIRRPAPSVCSAAARTPSLPKLAIVQKKTFASEVASCTRTTTLDNGVTVATESNPLSPLATVGAWFFAGSRAEPVSSRGAADVLERLTLKGTKRRPESAMDRELDSFGGRLHSYTSREQNAFYAVVLKNDVGKALEIISDVVQNPVLNSGTLETAKKEAIEARRNADQCPETVTFDHLYATAFQGSTFGSPVIATEGHISALTCEEIAAFHSENFNASRLVVAGAGNVDHDELVSLAVKAFGGLKPGSSRPRGAPRFVGSDIRLRDDTAPEMQVALAVRSPGLADNDYPTSLVMQAIVGSWDRALGARNNLFTKMSPNANTYGLCNSYASFCEAYSDVGLWGTYIVSEHLSGIDDFVWFLQKEWARLTEAPTEGDVHIAKNKIINAIAHNVGGSSAAVADDIGRQLTATGRRLSVRELSNLVDRVTWKDVSRVAGNYLWDGEVVVVGVGPIEGLTDFARIRGHMARNIW